MIVRPAEKRQIGDQAPVPSFPSLPGEDRERAPAPLVSWVQHQGLEKASASHEKGDHDLVAPAEIRERAIPRSHPRRGGR